MTPKVLIYPLLLVAALLLAMPLVSAADDEPADQVAPHLMRAELAIEEKDYLGAVNNYLRAAELSDNPEIARQATRLAFDYGFDEIGEEAAERWLKLDPGSDEALVHLAQIQLRLGDVRSARRNFADLIERGDRPADERLMGLMPFISREDPEDADALMRALAKPYRDSALAHYATAAVALQAEDVDYALEKSARAIELDPEWLQPKLLYARAMLLSGDVEEAIDYTARIIGDDPDPDPDARMELALLYMTAGRDEDALSQADQVILERFSRTDALRMRGIINFRLNRLEEAWADFEELLGRGDYTMDALFYLGRISDFRGEHERAIRLYSEVTSGKNAVPSQRRAAAIMTFEKDDLDGAIAHLDNFSKARPTFAVDIALVKAGLFSAMDRKTEALELFDKAIAWRPEDEGIALGRAELMLQMGRLDDAVDAYRAAAKRWSDSAITLNALGYTLADRTEEYREAERLIRKALKLNPDSPAIIDSMGWVLHKRGKHEEALGYLETAYEQFPDHEVAAHIVEVLSALGRHDEALEFLVAAEAETPDSDLLLDVRERLFPESP